MITICRKGVKGTMKVSDRDELKSHDYVVGGLTRGYVLRRGTLVIGLSMKLSEEGFPVDIPKDAVILHKIKFLP